MKILTATLFLSFLMLSHSSFAQSVPDFDLAFRDKMTVKEKQRLSNVTREALDLVARYLPVDMSMPKRIKFVFSTENRNEYFTDAKVLTVKTVGDNATMMKAIIHELGHAVIEESVDARLSPELRSLHGQLKELSARRFEIEKQMHDQAANGTLDYNQMNKKLSDVNEKISHFPDFQMAFLTYQEFFADSLNVTVTEDPAANVYDAGEKFQEEVDFSRNFATGTSRDSLARWQKGLTPPKTFGFGRHYAFSPARWDFWGRIKNRISQKSGKTAVIEALHQGTITAFSEFFSEMSVSYQKALKQDTGADFMLMLTESDMSQLNKKLIQSLAIELNKAH